MSSQSKMETLTKRDIMGYWNIKRSIMVGNISEEDIPNWPQDAIVEITTERGEPFRCPSLSNASKLMQVS